MPQPLQTSAFNIRCQIRGWLALTAQTLRLVITTETILVGIKLGFTHSTFFVRNYQQTDPYVI
jgi:hypothetical protein